MLGAIKFIGQAVISIGVSSIVDNVVKSTTPENIGAIKKLCIGVTALVIGSMLTETVYNHAEAKAITIAEKIKSESNKKEEKGA